jgi:SOS response regulatory protein OraA/RecX
LIRDIIRETFESQGEEDRARRVLEKKFKGKDLSDPRILRRAAAFLEQRGYSTQAISALLRSGTEWL